MASYRPFPPPPQSTFAPPPPPLPNQTSLPQPPLAPVPQVRGNQFSQNWGYSGGGVDGSASFPQNFSQMHTNSNIQHGGYVPSSSSQPYSAPPRNPIPPPPPPHQQPYSYTPPPPSEPSYQPPPPPSMSQTSINPPPPQPAPPAPPAPMYYPSSQYSQFNQQPLQPPPPPPPPPPSSPPNSLAPPPPPPLSQPPSPPPPPSASQIKESRPVGEKGPPRDLTGSGWRDPGHSSQGAPLKQHTKSSALPPVPVKKSNGPPGRIETEEERRLRKKRELEKQRQEEKHRHQLKESQNKVLQKTQMLSSGAKGHGSISGSHMGERRATPFLSSERIENRLKKPTTFLCKLKFRDELPEPTDQEKLFSMGKKKDRYKYAVSSLEKVQKPQLFVEPDLGIPLDLLDLSVYNHSKDDVLPMNHEDEELLQDDVAVTPVKKDGLKRKERPTDKGVSWLVKTQYISPLSMEATRQSLTEKQAKELREKRGGSSILDNLNTRKMKIQAIEASFEACKSRPVHTTNKDLQPVELLPLLPDFDRFNDRFVVATFDSAPTADSEIYNKMDKSVRDAHESQAIMKSLVATTSDSGKPDKFLAYMVPSAGELSKDMYDEREDISYTWIREYHWDVRGEDADDPTNYLVAFDESEARYMPLPTKLMLRKKRAREGKTSVEVEHFPVPSRVTVRQRPTVSIVMRDPENYAGTKGNSSNPRHERMDIEDGLSRQHKGMQDAYLDQSSGAEYESE